MADKLTVARPYARAAFEEARDTQRLAEWSQALEFAATVVSDPRVARLLGHPRVTPTELAQLVGSIAATELGAAGENFLLTLAENRRLAYLPEITAQFEVLKDEAQGMADVTLTSAAALDAGERDKIVAALERRLKRKVRLQCAVDPALIGGAVLRCGDLVIDGSVKTRLERFAYELTA